jgi:alkanesulfonate monooxygenase SsuD/methylene tetrahydromethanopterin reductase-like flavin-dependent oxidoreductase (luciferase family)
MKYGFILVGNPTEVVELAQKAEQAGWDGVFLPDDWTSSWIKLTAIAMRTQRIQLGTMLTPLPEQFPWYVAAQTATLDQLSGGRVIITAGLGVLELDKFGMRENKVRAQRLDEALTIVNGWWQGKPMRTFTYEGQHYRLQEMSADVDWPTHMPLQKPRIPIWVIGGPKQSQLQRAARWDGAVINGSPTELRERKAAIEALRTASTPVGSGSAQGPTIAASPMATASDHRPLDIITEGETPPNDPARATDIVAPYVEAGLTWWLESVWDFPGVTRDYDIRTRVRSGPPRVSH